MPTAIILAAVALVTLYAYQWVTEYLVIERDRELTRLSANLLATELAAYSNPLTDHFLTAFDAMVVFNANGTVLAVEPEQPEGWGIDWLNSLPFRQVFRSSTPIFSDVIVDGFQGDKVVVVVMPISGSGGKPVGGVAGLFSLDPAAGSALYRSMEKLDQGKDDRIYLVDSDGKVIYHSDHSHVGDDFSAQVVVQRVLGGESGAFRSHDLNGREIVASFAPVPDTSWGLVIEESWAALISPSRRYGQFLLFLLTLGLIIPVLIVAIGVRRITQPIAELIVAAQEMAGGNFNRKLVAPTGDELEDLAEQFNFMAVQLQESYAYLERKVTDRTKELAALNTIAAVVSRSLDLEEILSDALDETLALMGMTIGQAFCLEEEAEILTLMAHRGLQVEFVRRTLWQPLEAGASGQAVIEGRPVVKKIADYPAGKLKEMAEKEGLQLVISIPLMAKRKMVGAIDLGTHSPRAFGTEELDLLAAIGNQVGLAVENARLYEQAQQLAVVKERNRLARDLHDSVMQALYGVTLYAEAAARQLSSGEMSTAAEHLSEIREIAQESLREMRLLIFELRPPMLKKEGFVAALQARLEAVEARVGLETDLQVEGDGRLLPKVEEGLYRVAQEALNNALKHAHATIITVRLYQNGRTAILEIIDDGIGFDPAMDSEGGGFGLRGMEERAARMGGKLAVQSNPGEGTRIRVEVFQ